MVIDSLLLVVGSSLIGFASILWTHRQSWQYSVHCRCCKHQLHCLRVSVHGNVLQNQWFWILEPKYVCWFVVTRVHPSPALRDMFEPQHVRSVIEPEHIHSRWILLRRIIGNVNGVFVLFVLLALFELFTSVNYIFCFWNMILKYRSCFKYFYVLFLFH